MASNRGSVTTTYGWRRSAAIRVIVAFLLMTFGLVAPVAARSKPVRWYVGHVDFRGNRTFGRNMLLDRMICRPSWLLSRTPFLQSALDDDISVLRLLYRNQGFLKSNVELASMDRDSLHHRVHIQIEIREERRTMVDSVAIEGHFPVPSKTVQDAVKTSKGKPLIGTQVDQDVRAIFRCCSDHGYLYAKVVPSVELDSASATAVVRFVVAPGGPVRTGQISIGGLHKISDQVARNELKFKKGDSLTTVALEESTRLLYNTNLFKTVTLTPDDSGVPPCDTQGGCVRNVRVQLSESDLFQIDGGVGYGTADQFRSSLGATYKNLFGLGKRIKLQGQLSVPVQQAELDYTDPHLLGLPWSLDASSSYGRFDQPAYDAKVIGLKAGAGYTTTRHSTYRIGVEWEDVPYLKSAIVIDSLEQRKTALFTANYALDLRDNVFNPTKGFFLSVEGDIAGLIGTSNRFVRGIVDIRGYFPWISGITFSTGAQAGAVHEYLPSTSVPITERFFAGGGASIRGFGEKTLGPDSLDSSGTVVPVGGRYSLVVHVVEMRFPIYKLLFGALFFDAGNVWGAAEDIERDGLRTSVGAGIRLNLPLGVVRLDAGLRLNKNPYHAKEPIGAVHFEIGQAF